MASPLRPVNQPAAISSIPLWDQAFKNVQSSDRWSLFEKILARRPVAAGEPFHRDYDDLVKVLKDIQTQADKSQSGRLQKLKAVSLKVAEVLQVLKDVGSAAANLNPYASLAWSCVQFMLQAATTNHEVKQLCLEELPRISSLAACYQTVEQIYEISSPAIKSKAHYEAALLKLYESIMLYQVVMVVYIGSKMEKLKMIFRPATKDVISESIKTMKECEDEVSRNLMVVGHELADKRLANLESQNAALQRALADLNDTLDAFSNALDYVSAFVQDSRHDSILSWISSYLYRNSHCKEEKSALEDTGYWLLQDKVFEDWRTQGRSSALWLKGFMGSGKSCLTTKVIKLMLNGLKLDDTERLAYFYCDGTDNAARVECSDAASILRCLLKQLATRRNKEIHQSIVRAWEAEHLRSLLQRQDCVDLIFEIGSTSSLIMLIIDGLDECDADVQRDLTEALRKLILNTPCTVKIFISGRPNVYDVVNMLQPLEIDVRDKNTSDIATYVHHTAKEAENDPQYRRLYIKDSVSRRENVEHLIRSKSDGMFRWAQMAFTVLHSNKYYDAMSRRLDQLSTPKKLFDLYDMIWDEVHKDLDEVDKEILRTVLMFVLWGADPPVIRVYTMENGKEFKIYHSQACRHIAQAAFFISSRVFDSVFPLEDAVRICPNFLEYEGLEDEIYSTKRFKRVINDSILRLQHISIREYLMSKRKEEFAEITGHAFLTRLCLEVCLAKYNSVDDKLSAENHICNYAAFEWSKHLLKVKQLAGGNLDSYLNKDPALRIALNGLLGTDEPKASPAWVEWTRWAHKMGILVSHRTRGWATEPPSTAVAHIALGLPLEPLCDAALKIKADGCGHEIDLLVLAIRCQNQAAIDLLRRRGFVEKPVIKDCVVCFLFYVKPYEKGCKWDSKTRTIIWSRDRK
jgi:hypothetical protein